MEEGTLSSLGQTKVWPSTAEILQVDRVGVVRESQVVRRWSRTKLLATLFFHQLLLFLRIIRSGHRQVVAILVSLSDSRTYEKSALTNGQMVLDSNRILQGPLSATRLASRPSISPLLPCFLCVLIQSVSGCQVFPCLIGGELYQGEIEAFT